MFGITRKFPGDPWAELLYNLERRMGRAFGEPYGFNWQFNDAATAAWTPVVDIFEETGHLRIVAEIPGVKPDAVKILVENNVLTIQGTKEQVAEEKTEKVHRYERAYGAFERSFTLPTTVEATNIKATYDMGVLTLILPKVEKAKPREIKLEVVPEKKLKA
ncbi:MAG TPA: Hsp20/alpha crystallin family protein [Gemmatimonadales bacterium]|nr:Hsp20/alpha crystallin family protein [Gemmatimonadales bacterium]